MGLYQKICDKFLNQDNIDSFNDQNCVGLLAKAEQFLSNMENIDCLKFDKPFVFFKNFASEVGLNKVAVLVPYENVYHTIFSYGIEPASREETISTCDFWDGTLTSNQWYSLADEDLSSFYQLFSYDDAQVLKHLHIKKFQIDENTYAIILILEDTLTSLIDLETIEIILPNLKEQLLPIITLINDGALFPKNEDLSEIKERINSEVAKFNTGFMHSISLKSIFRALGDYVSFEDYYHIFSMVYHVILSLKNETDILYFSEELEIKNISFSQTSMDLVEYSNNLHNLLKNSFELIENPQLEIKYHGNSFEKSEILDFLFSET